MRLVSIANIAWITAFAAPAFAAPTEADVAFERGRTLLAANQFDEACAAFEESIRLDFQFGTLFNLADCNDRRGHLATALSIWKRIAKEDHNAGRSQQARANADKLGPRVPRIVITLKPAGTAARITLDGTSVEDVAIPVAVDFGSHTLVATTPDGHSITRTIDVTKEAVRIPVELELPSAQATPETPAPAARTPRRVTAGKITFGLGLASVAAGLVVGGVTYRAWRDAEDTAKTDVPQANDDLDRVRLLGNVSTGLVAAGIVAAAVGVYLWRSEGSSGGRSGSSAVQATASAGADRASLGIYVTF